MTEQQRKRPPAARGKMRELTSEILDGFAVEQMKCRSCSGYGNCGYKSYFVNPEGGVLSICMQQRRQLQCERDGIEFDPKDI